jgi:oligopeptide transport system ATP-binding protein
VTAHEAAPLLEARNLDVVFRGGMRALAGVSLAVDQGEILGLVGESGSGKTTLCRAMLGLLKPAAGGVVFEGEALESRLARDPLGFRRSVQMLLQDAGGSLSPRHRIGALLDEPFRIHGLSLDEGRARIARLMGRLALPAAILDRYPHQISGGQARRVAILRALALAPDLIVADEPTAGLDVSVRGELLNLLLDLKSEFGLTYLVVSHDLAAVRRIATRVAVMHLGQIVEEGPAAALFDAPAHPYTAALVSSAPSLDPVRRRARIVLEGEMPSLARPPSGCRFRTRCWQARDRCAVEEPALAPLGDSRRARCHFPLSGPPAP